MDKKTIFKTVYKDKITTYNILSYDKYPLCQIVVTKSYCYKLSKSFLDEIKICGNFQSCDGFLINLKVYGVSWDVQCDNKHSEGLKKYLAMGIAEKYFASKLAGKINKEIAIEMFKKITRG